MQYQLQKTFFKNSDTHPRFGTQYQFENLTNLTPTTPPRVHDLCLQNVPVFGPKTAFMPALQTQFEYVVCLHQPLSNPANVCHRINQYEIHSCFKHQLFGSIVFNAIYM